MKYEKEFKKLQEEKSAILKQLIAEKGKSLRDFEKDKLGLFLVKLGSSLVKVEFGYQNEKYSVKEGDVCFIKKTENIRENFKNSNGSVAFNSEFHEDIKISLKDRTFNSLSKSDTNSFNLSKRIIISLIVNTNSITSIYLTEQEVKSLLRAETSSETKLKYLEKYGEELKRISKSESYAGYWKENNRTLEFDLKVAIHESAILLSEKRNNPQLSDDLINFGEKELEKIVSMFDITRDKEIDHFFANKLLKFGFSNEIKRLLKVEYKKTSLSKTIGISDDPNTTDVESTIADESPTPEEQLLNDQAEKEKNEKKRLFRKEFEKLSEKKKVALLLKRAKGKTYEEMSRILEENTNTLKARVERAENELKNKLNNLGR